MKNKVDQIIYTQNQGELELVPKQKLFSMSSSQY